MSRERIHQRYQSIGDPIRFFIEHLPEFDHAAQEALTTEAYSYRNFHVAGALFATRSNTDAGALFVAGNLKANPDKTKICSEHKVLGKNHRTSFDHIVGILVKGTTDRTKIGEVNHINVPTLWPCPDACVPELEANPRVGDETLIVTTGMGRRGLDKIFQVHLFGQIRDMYCDGSWDSAGQQIGEDISAGTDERLAAYDLLTAAELTVPAEQRRSAPVLARMALMTAV